jgi:hypothetical protein
MISGNPSKQESRPRAWLVAAFVVAASAAHAQSAPAASDAGAPIGSGDTAGQSDTDLAKKIQNPIGDLYSFPFQNNTNFGFGPHGGTQDVLNVQPVIPIHITPDWNIITRTILPLAWTPDLSPGRSTRRSPASADRLRFDPRDHRRDPLTSDKHI